ncbi:MAG: hypothetical protein AUI47_05850 [Acidobacteria bacterium 13_1_40CM_2_68_5]|nr:MAG: hypothetical protein AUI47_05850 [Acidobacteria bacterium 13_1_40CM_2_68_5]
MTTWFDEGSAELYSILLSRRAGITHDTLLLSDLNDNATVYYTNPLRTLSNAQLAQRFWKDPRAQRLPYARGLMYLARVDAQVRAKSDGKRRLDDIVLALVDRQRKGLSHGISDWLDLVRKELGPQAKADLDAMVEGKQLNPYNAFAPCFRFEAFKQRLFYLGFDGTSWSDTQKIVRGVVAGSAAARAGSQDGDVVVDSTELWDLQGDDAKDMVMKVRRHNRELTIRYLPRGATVDSYHWVRATNVPDSVCEF